jgi:hypothetical protein
MNVKAAIAMAAVSNKWYKNQGTSHGTVGPIPVALSAFVAGLLP